MPRAGLFILDASANLVKALVAGMSGPERDIFSFFGLAMVEGGTDNLPS